MRRVQRSGSAPAYDRDGANTGPRYERPLSTAAPDRPEYKPGPLPASISKKQLDEMATCRFWAQGDCNYADEKFCSRGAHRVEDFNIDEMISRKATGSTRNGRKKVIPRCGGSPTVDNTSSSVCGKIPRIVVLKFNNAGRPVVRGGGEGSLQEGGARGEGKGKGDTGAEKEDGRGCGAGGPPPERSPAALEQDPPPQQHYSPEGHKTFKNAVSSKPIASNVEYVEVGKAECKAGSVPGKVNGAGEQKEFGGKNECGTPGVGQNREQLGAPRSQTLSNATSNTESSSNPKMPDFMYQKNNVVDDDANIDVRKNFSVMSLNANGLVSKFASFEQIVAKTNPDLIFVQESRLRAASKTLTVRGYHSFQRTRPEGSGGGIITFVSDKWKLTSSVTGVGEAAEFITVRIEAGKTKLAAINIYGAVEKDKMDEIDKRWAEIEREIKFNLEEGCEIVAGGDWNTFLGALSEDNQWGIKDNPVERISHGGRCVQSLLQNGDFQILNNLPGVTGGPCTHKEIQARGAESVLTFLIATNNLAMKMKKMLIDNEKKMTVKRPATKARPAMHSDHYTVMVEFHNTEFRYKKQESKRWLIDQAGLKRFGEATDAAVKKFDDIVEALSKEEIDVDLAWKKWERQLERCMFASFLRLSKVQGGKKEKTEMEVGEELLKDEILLKNKLNKIQEMMETALNHNL